MLGFAVNAVLAGDTDELQLATQALLGPLAIKQWFVIKRTIHMDILLTIDKYLMNTVVDKNMPEQAFVSLAISQTISIDRLLLSSLSVTLFIVTGILA